MIKTEVTAILNCAIDTLYEKEHFLMDQSYDINERTIVHRFAIYLEQLLENRGLHVDIEYNRMRDNYGDDDVGNILGKKINWEKSGEGQSYVYPDIIVHKRDTDYNFIEIEVKMAWKNRKREFDYQKINEYINQIGYLYGVYIELDETRENCLIEFGPFEIKKTLAT